MHYHIYCNSKDFDVNYVDAIAEFAKRLSAYCNITLHKSTSLQFPNEITSKNHQFLQIISGPSTYTSIEFAGVIDTLQQSGKSTVHILIGFTDEDFYAALYKLPNFEIPLQLSLTNCNLPVSTLTLFLYEQLYRGYTILHGKTYHK